MKDNLNKSVNLLKVKAIQTVNNYASVLTAEQLVSAMVRATNIYADETKAESKDKLLEEILFQKDYIEIKAALLTKAVQHEILMDNSMPKPIRAWFVDNNLMLDDLSSWDEFVENFRHTDV